MKTVYFIRHGQTDANIAGAQQGAAEPLNTTGLRQAEIVAERVKHLPVERIIASSMTRAQQTATAVAAASGLSFETSDLFREFAIPTDLAGALPDPDPAAPLNQYLVEREQFAADPEWRCGDGENFCELAERVAMALAYLADQTEEYIAVVSHGRFLRVLGGCVVQGGTCAGADVVTFARTLKLTNAGISVFQYNDDRWQLLTWNDMNHFAE